MYALMAPSVEVEAGFEGATTASPFKLHPRRNGHTKLETRPPPVLMNLDLQLRRLLDAEALTARVRVRVRMRVRASVVLVCKYERERTSVLARVCAEWLRIMITHSQKP